MGLLLIGCLLLLGGVVTAQGGGDFFVEVLREPGRNSAADYARIAIEPTQGLPVVIRRESGSRFGADRIHVEVFTGEWESQTTNGLMHPETNIITPKGIDLAFDEDGVLYAAINREFSAQRESASRTLVARFGAGGWVPVGDPFGGQTVGAPYLFESDEGLTYVSIEISEEGYYELRARVFNGGSWEPLGASSLNIEQGTDVTSAFAAVDGEGQPIVAWAEYSEEFGVTLAFADYWDGRRWQEMPELPLVADMEIGDVELSGLVAGDDESVFLATSEPFDRTNFVDIWLQSTDYDSEWGELGLPNPAADTDCAVGHAFAAGPDDTLYYAWAEPCEGVIRLSIGTEDDGWRTADSEVRIQRMRGEAPPLQLAVDASGNAFVLWIENGSAGVAVFAR